MIKLFFRGCFVLLIIGAVFSCKPSAEKITTDQGAMLSFSRDTLLFDTLFTSIGSASKRLTVFNPNDKAVVISKIQLAGMANSSYKVIINGREAVFQSDIELRGRDSLFIIVRVNINPLNADQPYLVKDSILFETNSNHQKVMLVAYGQDANFIHDGNLPCNTTWDSPKPYVINGSVTIPEGCNLTIRPGVRVFFGNQAYMYIKGGLIAEGEPENPIIFTSDKLQQSFKDQPGLWSGIRFSPSSRGNIISYAKIRNASTGILLENANQPAQPVLKMSQCLIENMSVNGVESINTNIELENTLIHNTPGYAFLASGGGISKIHHCTMANYSYLFFRKNATIGFADSKRYEDGNLIQNPINADIVNSIIWGDKAEELELQHLSSSTFEVSISNSIVRSTLPDQGTDNKYNQDPMFVNSKTDFNVSEGSPAIKSGRDIGIIIDLTGKNRVAPPDMGAYEH